ncbi:MAG: hypothetical protein WCO06_07490 [Candidatus Roizmanbacteria bacterium]
MKHIIKQKHIFLFFLIFLISEIVLAFFASLSVPYAGNFIYKHILGEYGFPYWLASFTNFDGVHYILIARQGYLEYSQAFFPVYPLLIRYLAPIFLNNHMIVALVISYTSLFIALIILKKYLKEISFSASQTFWFIAFLLTFPTSYYFGAIYTESVFLLTFVSTLYFLEKKNFAGAMVCAILTALTRLIGIFLIIPILFYFLNIVLNEHKNSIKTISQFFLRSYKWFLKNKLSLIVILSPILGFAIYAGYLFYTHGDPFYFYTSQPKFGANRSTHLIFFPQVIYRYVRIFMTAQFNIQYCIAFLELISFIFAISCIGYELFVVFKTKNWFVPRSGIALFSLISIILPTLTGTFSSMPRYTLMSFSTFFVISTMKNRIVKYIFLASFILLHITLTALFIQGYFIS